jgi:hypothetical protein
MLSNVILRKICFTALNIPFLLCFNAIRQNKLNYILLWKNYHKTASYAVIKSKG